jgi:death on curing protein
VAGDVRWIHKKALLLLHEESLAQFGGPSGIRDEGLLDSALARPRNLHAYQPDSTAAQLAAAYAYGLIRNHPFVDGNKRAGFLSIGLFLGINGYELTADQVDAVQTILAVAAGELDEKELAEWIARNSARA